MKALHTAGSISREAGGLFFSVRALCQALQGFGVKVSAASAHDACTAEDTGTWYPVEVHAFRAWHPQSLRFTPELRQHILHNNADLLHTHGIWQYPSIAALAWKRRLNRPHIVSPRGMLEPWARDRSKWKKRPLWWLFERRNLRTANVLHATSVQEADGIRALGLTNPIAIIPNGVDLPVLRCFGASVVQSEGEVSRIESTEPPQYRNTETPNYRITETPIHRQTALFLSRIHPKKGLLNLISAWAQVRPANWRLIICGPDEGNHTGAVRAAAAAAGIQGEVEFRPALYGEEKTELMTSADLFVLPSFSENFGIAIAEALGAGVPVITTKGTPWEELITHRCGWWVDIGVESLAAALREAMALSDGERCEMGERGRRLVEARYSWPRIAREMMSVYEWILGKGPVPSCVVFK